MFSCLFPDLPSDSSTSPFIQMGSNIKEFLRLVEDFVNMIGVQMSGFQDIYEVTENLGER